MIELAQVAQVTDATLVGTPMSVRGMASLDQAGAQDLSFLMPGRRPETAAGALLLREQDRGDYAGVCLFVQDPYLAFAQASALFEPAWMAQPGIAPSAQVDPSAQLGEGVQLAAGVVIEAGVTIGAHTAIRPNTWIGANCQIGTQCQIGNHVSMYPGCRVGDQGRIHSGAVIGADGFGFAPSDQGWVKIHQLGGVWIGDRIEIGANTTIDRGALDDTHIADGVKIDNQVMIAHNCRIGAGTAIAACVGMAGSTEIGANCTIGGAAGFTGHLSICDNVHIGAMTLVAGDIRQSGAYAGGVQGARPMRDWKRNMARFNQLDSLAQRLIALEKKINR